VWVLRKRGSNGVGSGRGKYCWGCSKIRGREGLLAGRLGKFARKGGGEKGVEPGLPKKDPRREKELHAEDPIYNERQKMSKGYL